MARARLIGADYDHDPYWMQHCVRDALVCKLLGKQPPEHLRGFYGRASFVELAHADMVRRRVDHGLHPDRDHARIVTEALAQTHSDFPTLLGDVIEKLLLAAYQNAQPTYRTIGSEVELRSFQPHTLARPGAFPDLLETNEYGEFKYGTTADRGETITAATYGRILSLTREAIVNDDVQALANMAQQAGARIADFENAVAFATWFGAGLGPTMSDGNALFDAAHANVGVAGALNATTLGSARSLLRAQTTTEDLKLNLPARHLLVSPESATTAEQLLETLHGDPMQTLADANLSGTRFYVIAPKSALQTFVFGRVGPDRGPRIETRANHRGFAGVEFKVAVDFGAGVADWRGAATGAGA